MTMTRVLMIGNHSSNKGGMTSVINQIKEYDWKSKGIELTFVPTFIPGNAVKKTLFFICAYLRICMRMLFCKPDIVHMHMSYKGSFSRKYIIHRLCRLFKVKDVIHLHGSEFEKWYNESSNKKKNKIRRLLAESNAFIVLGEGWKKAVQKIEPTVNAVVISNGIEIPQERVHWNGNCCQLLFLGVLIQRKGVSDLLQALSIVKQKSTSSKIRVVIAGTGEEEAKLKKQASDAGLDDDVIFAGWVSGLKKKELILSSQVMVSPSYNEGLPISLLEAESYGMPIVATDVGDISSIVNDGVNGRLIKPGEIESLAEAIISVTEETCFERMSIESRKIIENSFSIDMFYSKLVELYKRLGENNA